MQNLMYDINILNGLFTEKDFDFLKNSNSYESNIDIRLKSAIKKRDKIIEYKTYISDNSSISKDTVDATENAFKSINEIIVSLYNLKENIQEIEKVILELIVKKENHSYSDKDLNSSISEIKQKINDFDSYSNKIDKIIFSNYIIVKSFFEKYYSTTFDDAPTMDDVNYKTESHLEKQDSSQDLGISDNLVLKISGKENKVYLPYYKSEILDYMQSYPDVYKTAQDVIDREYIVGLTFFTRHPVLARFRETYSLIHNREMKSVTDALKRALDLMFKYELNPAIIAGLKSEADLDLLLDCLDKKNLDNFKPFKIVFEYNPV